MAGERFQVHLNFDRGPAWVLVDTTTGCPVELSWSPLYLADQALILNGQESRESE